MTRTLPPDEQYASSAGGSARTRTIIKAQFLPTSAPASGGRGRGARTRTVVKANFKRTAVSSARTRLKKSADYYAHRPDADGQRAMRLAFGAEHDELGREEVHALIEDAEAQYGYRMVLSPGQDLDETELIDWTRGVMRELERDQDADWIGYAHASQTEHPHVHVIAFLEERLDREDFAHLREHGDWESTLVMRAWHSLERLMEDDEDEAASGGAKSPRGSGGGGGGGGSNTIAEMLRAGMDEQDEALQKRLELEFD